MNTIKAYSTDKSLQIKHVERKKKNRNGSQPHNFNKNVLSSSRKNIVEVYHPKVFFDIDIDGKNLGRIIFELFASQLPIIAENFRCKCTGEDAISPDTGSDSGFRRSRFHRIVSNFIIQGGNASNTEDIHEIIGDIKSKVYEGEMHHPSATGKLLCSVNNGDGYDSRGIQFFIALKRFISLPSMLHEEAGGTGKFIEIGKVIQGHKVIQEINNVAGTESGVPSRTVTISRSGEMLYFPIIMLPFLSNFPSCYNNNLTTMVTRRRTTSSKTKKNRRFNNHYNNTDDNTILTEFTNTQLRIKLAWGFSQFETDDNPGSVETSELGWVMDRIGFPFSLEDHAAALIALLPTGKGNNNNNKSNTNYSDNNNKLEEISFETHKNDIQLDEVLVDAELNKVVTKNRIQLLPFTKWWIQYAFREHRFYYINSSYHNNDHNTNLTTSSLVLSHNSNTHQQQGTDSNSGKVNDNYDNSITLTSSSSSSVIVLPRISIDNQKHTSTRDDFIRVRNERKNMSDQVKKLQSRINLLKSAEVKSWKIINETNKRVVQVEKYRQRKLLESTSSSTLNSHSYITNSSSYYRDLKSNNMILDGSGSAATSIRCNKNADLNNLALLKRQDERYMDIELQRLARLRASQAVLSQKKIMADEVKAMRQKISYDILLRKRLNLKSAQKKRDVIHSQHRRLKKQRQIDHILKRNEIQNVEYKKRMKLEQELLFQEKQNRNKLLRKKDLMLDRIHTAEMESLKSIHKLRRIEGFKTPLPLT